MRAGERAGRDLAYRSPVRLLALPVVAALLVVAEPAHAGAAVFVLAPWPRLRRERRG